MSINPHYLNYGDSQPEDSMWNKSGIEISVCSSIENFFTTIIFFAENRIAFVSLAMIMVLTGITFGVGYCLSITTATPRFDLSNPIHFKL